MQQLAVFSTSDRHDLDPDLAAALARAVDDQVELETDDFLCLADGRAYEAPISLDIDAVAQLRQIAQAEAIDVNIVPTEGRRKKLLIADMDSTMITGESLDDMAALAGLAESIIPITRRAMNGELDFEAALDERVALLAGYPENLVERALAETELTAGARLLVRTMRNHGADCYLVSGGFTAITGPIAAACGFTDHRANSLETANGVLTGRVLKPVLDREAKARFLHEFCQNHGIATADAAAIGDGSNDLAMLEAAGFGVAFHGKEMLRKQVELQLNHTDLTGLLYLQGFSEAEFTTD